MISKTEVTRRQITRGSILSALWMSQNAPMAVQTIELALLPENPQIGSDMVPCINFLADRGYVAIISPEEPSVNPMRSALVRITDKGQDVVEGMIKDDSIILPRG